MTTFHTRYSEGISHAKIILIGEHSVVYGKPAIALPLSEVKTTVTIEQTYGEPSSIKSRYFDGPLSSMPKNMQGLKHLILLILKTLNKQKEQFKMTIKSDLPAERGMGSSAATAIAVIRALYSFFELELTQDKLLSLANVSEVDMHGNPSGLDAATSASSQPIWMIRNKELKKIPIHLDGCLLICDSGIKGKTSAAVASVRNLLKKNPHDTKLLLEELERLAFSARNQLSNNDIVGLGDTFNKAQEQLQKLGVSNQKLDKLIALSKDLGSLGSKLTGGGRGGCFICLMPSIKLAKKAIPILKHAGTTTTWIQPLGITITEEVN
ncbi:mevalonate kinase [Liquorilactobacillus cacaonum]|uniref:Mevalonate kinase n=1 Tax=Liquorilactobacillus cacaonum DSM 21116 TaxID=1423729 RepID=A0A0R2CGV7_9LACO|nr:mevalonate kinase [Liquorilactobacillus cacaonum]KRM90895.1 mevalonate kinase [Liquorilactobacillus cacaonum DSM 21116]